MITVDQIEAGLNKLAVHTWPIEQVNTSAFMSKTERVQNAIARAVATEGFQVLATHRALHTTAHISEHDHGCWVCLQDANNLEILGTILRKAELI